MKTACHLINKGNKPLFFIAEGKKKGLIGISEQNILIFDG